MRARRTIIPCFALLAAAATAQAQTAQPFSIQASGLYASLFGSAFDGLGAGLGFEGQVRFTTRMGMSFGLGYQHTLHSITGLPDDIALAGPFFEPRYTLPVDAERYAPYLSARASVLQQNYDANGISGSASGFTINAGGGMLIRLASRANLDIGATYGFTDFGDFTIVGGTGTLTGPSGSGSNVIARVGLAIGVF